MVDLPFVVLKKHHCLITVTLIIETFPSRTSSTPDTRPRPVSYLQHETHSFRVMCTGRTTLENELTKFLVTRPNQVVTFHNTFAGYL